MLAVLQSTLQKGEKNYKHLEGGDFGFTTYMPGLLSCFSVLKHIVVNEVTIDTIMTLPLFSPTSSPSLINLFENIHVYIARETKVMFIIFVFFKIIYIENLGPVLRSKQNFPVYEEIKFHL